MENLLRLVIADDLTGANDSGVHFLSEDASVVVVVDPASPDYDPKGLHARTIVLNTNSRSLDASEAYTAIREIMQKFSLLEPKEIYKKIDSTLRGNIGAEIDAVMDTGGLRIACVAPATPRNGRTVHDGLCYVHGVPLDATEVAHDPFTPVQGSDIRKIIAKQTKRSIGLLPLRIIRSPLEQAIAYVRDQIASGIEIVVTDAMTTEDLKKVRTIFLSLDEQILYVGSAGFFHALELSQNPGSTQLDLQQKVSLRVLMVIGSMMETSVVQVDHLMQHSHIHDVHQLITQNAIENTQKETERLVQDIRHSFTAAQLVLLKTDRDNSKHSGHLIVGSVLGQVVNSVLADGNIDVLVITGGDTAKHILKIVQVDEFELIDEALPGIPVGLIQVPTRKEPIVFVSKAGSFGEPNALEGVFTYIKKIYTIQAG